MNAVAEAMDSIIHMNLNELQETKRLIQKQIELLRERERLVKILKPDYLSYAEQARQREKSGFGIN